MTLTLKDLFDIPGSDVDRVQRLEAYKSALADAHAESDSGQVWINPGERTLQKGIRPDKAEQVLDTITKGLTAEAAASLQQDLAAVRGALMPDIRKDWTTSSPINVAPYDLLAPARFLVPRYTPLRNRIPRSKGQGTACEYRRILSVTNSGQASAQIMPFFDSAAQTATFGGPGNLTLNRPQKIAYTGDNQTRSYKELGFSDQVNWKAQFASLGFENPRAQSRTANLLAHMMGEERAILFGRGTNAGDNYLGPVSAPVISASNAGVGGTIPADTYHCYVVALNGMGQSVPSAVSSTVTAGATSTITVDVTTEPDGGIHYALYVGDDAVGFANARFQGNFIGNTVTITSFDAAGALGVATDTSYSALSWDGFYAVQSDPAQTGHFSRVNGAWSTSNPGSELTDMFVAMWSANGATPDEVWLTGNGADSLGELLRVGGANGAVNGYRTMLQTGDGQVVMGAAVSGIVNPVTRTMVDVMAHRFALPGTALALSKSIPVQDNQVDAPASIRNVQDYMGVDWPIIQMSIDISSYQYGTMLHQAPAWSGMLAGITNG